MTFIVHVLHSVYKLFEGRYYIAYERKHKINLFVHSFLIENRCYVKFLFRIEVCSMKVCLTLYFIFIIKDNGN